MALEEWYIHVRRPFLESQEFGQFILSGLLDKLALAKKERIKRLQVLAEKAKISAENEAERKLDVAGRNEFHERFSEIEGLFAGGIQNSVVEKYRDDFLSASDIARSERGASYVAVIQGFPTHVSEKGVVWLQRIVDTFCEKAKAVMQSLNLFGN
jgi:UDP-N-acetylglucosamine/UDP-N-acetylgalactosamine diphosphorylase